MCVISRGRAIRRTSASRRRQSRCAGVGNGNCSQCKRREGGPSLSAMPSSRLAARLHSPLAIPTTAPNSPLARDAITFEIHQGRGRHDFLAFLESHFFRLAAALAAPKGLVRTALAFTQRGKPVRHWPLHPPSQHVYLIPPYLETPLPALGLHPRFFSACTALAFVCLGLVFWVGRAETLPSFVSPPARRGRRICRIIARALKLSEYGRVIFE